MTAVMVVLLCLYVGGLLAWAVARIAWGDRWVVTLAVSQMGPWLFLPALFFAPWVLLSRHALGALLLAIPAGLFLWFYGAMLLPPRAAPEPAQPLTVVSFNLQATNPDVEALVRLLELSAADVAGLQEVHDWQHRALSAALAGRYPHRWHDEGAGLAVYSIHPMIARDIYEVSAPAGAEPIWPIQSVVLQVGGTQVHVINAHLARTGIVPLLGNLDAKPMRSWTAVRAAQIDRIEEAIRERGLPAIVACDGNMTDLTAAYAALTANLRDAWRARGWGLGHTLLAPRSFEVASPVNVAVQRIDYLFSSPEIQPSRVRVLPHDSGSDHRPVWALFDLAPASAD
ncbi:MAG TPA: endonuclease/exonuclease/phosphatase family protein [Anaerolineae bacterium]|nr:endonuclease/exonuclease/phosphatase family protein [Anaerolineae bacterium]